MFNTENIYTKKVNETTIMIHCENGEEWEVYYKKPQYPFLFAFGIVEESTLDEAFEIAEANIDEYQDLFN